VDKKGPAEAGQVGMGRGSLDLAQKYSRVAGIAATKKRDLPAPLILLAQSTALRLARLRCGEHARNPTGSAKPGSTEYLRPHDVAQALVRQFLGKSALAFGIGDIGGYAFAISGGHLLEARAARSQDRHNADQRD
jgi:hypothetical protein